MKKSITLFAILLLTASGLSAQKLILGVKAPDLKVKEWFAREQFKNNAPTLLEFYYSRSEPSRRRLVFLDSLNSTNRHLNVIVMVCESRETAVSLNKNHSFIVALDADNKTFTAYGALFAPFGTLLDGRGKVLWFGNSSLFTEREINSTLKKR